MAKKLDNVFFGILVLLGIAIFSYIQVVDGNGVALSTVVAVIYIGIVGFYSGYKYAKKRAPAIKVNQ